MSNDELYCKRFGLFVINTSNNDGTRWLYNYICKPLLYNQSESAFDLSILTLRSPNITVLQLSRAHSLVTASKQSISNIVRSFDSLYILITSLVSLLIDTSTDNIYIRPLQLLKAHFSMS